MIKDSRSKMMNSNQPFIRLSHRETKKQELRTKNQELRTKNQEPRTKN